VPFIGIREYRTRRLNDSTFVVRKSADGYALDDGEIDITPTGNRILESVRRQQSAVHGELHRPTPG